MRLKLEPVDESFEPRESFDFIREINRLRCVPGDFGRCRLKNDAK